jgi:hypothetical protein
VREASVVWRVNHILNHNSDFRRVGCSCCEYVSHNYCSIGNVEEAVLGEQFVCCYKAFSVDSVLQLDLSRIYKFYASIAW